MKQSIEEKYKYAFSRERPAHELCDEFSLRHPRMPLQQRAKIFSPFAALRGFEEALESKLEHYVSRSERSEEDQARINRVLMELCARTVNGCPARDRPITLTVTYFVPCADEAHEAYGLRGTYETLTGTLRKIDPTLRKTIRIGETVISFSDISEIRIDTQAEEVE